jgi:hypothetical protein
MVVWSRRIKGSHEFGKWKRLHGKSPANHRGYVLMSLSGKTKEEDIYRFAHHLVLLAFVGQPLNGNMEACHNNGTRTDNRLENLRWDTPTGNQMDRITHGTDSRGEKHGQAILTDKQVETFLVEYINENWPVIKRDRKRSEINFCRKWSQVFNISNSGILRQILRQPPRWKHIKDKINFHYLPII